MPVLTAARPALRGISVPVPVVGFPPEGLVAQSGQMQRGHHAVHVTGTCSDTEHGSTEGHCQLQTL